MAATPKMKAVIFAGGVGTRMWPLSRKQSPKQFEPIIEGKSTLQLAVDRLRPEFAWEDIYISSGEVYTDLIAKQLPQIPRANIIGEPVMRDVAPAVGMLMTLLSITDADTPTAILWSDHLVRDVDAFKQALFAGASVLSKDPDRFIFIGQKPRFANQNLGWIEYGEELEQVDNLSVKRFISWHYRPDQVTAEKYFQSHKHAWNPGYFVVTPTFVLTQFKQHAPQMYSQLMEMKAHLDKPDRQQVINKIYPTMEKISFDDAVVTKTEPEKAVVISVELGWADIGTWEALKEAMLPDPTKNLEQGLVKTYDSQNNILYSQTDQLIAGIGIEDMTVVVTKDVVMVTPQKRIPDIKKLLASFEAAPEERYT
jgi:mannose-1-phosphate guanylyltransferase